MHFCNGRCVNNAVENRFRLCIQDVFHAPIKIKAERLPRLGGNDPPAVCGALKTGVDKRHHGYRSSQPQTKRMLQHETSLSKIQLV